MLTEPFDFVWDLMHTDDGIKVLEFQSAAVSGFSGWKKVTGQSMKRKIADFRKANGYRNGTSCGFMRAVCDRKNFMGSFLGPEIPQIFPKQKVYAYYPGNNIRAQIANDFGDSNGLVFKISKSAKANGVFFGSATDISPKNNKELARFFNTQTKGAFGTHNIPLTGHFLVQEGIIPKPVEAAGTWFLPTTRLAGTALPKQDGSVRWVFHGAYHKLPTKGYESEDEAKSHKISATGKNKIISKVKFSIGACAVDENTLEVICQQLSNAVGPVLKKLTQSTSKPFILKAFNSDNRGDRVSAVTYLCCPYRDIDNPMTDPELREPLLLEVRENPYAYAYVINQKNIPWREDIEKEVGRQHYIKRFFIENNEDFAPKTLHTFNPETVYGNAAIKISYHACDEIEPLTARIQNRWRRAQEQTEQTLTSLKKQFAKVKDKNPDAAYEKAFEYDTKVAANLYSQFMVLS